MKKIVCVLTLTVTFFCTIFTAFSYDFPEAYMGFSVPEGWHVFSKNMTDKTLLDSVGLSSNEVNELLLNADCEYFILNPDDNSRIFVKIKKNNLSYELYNISEIDDEILKSNIDRILKDGFSVDNFKYNSEEVEIKTYAQMKFITIPGEVMYDGKNHGMIFGITYVNGNGIGFMLYSDKDIICNENKELISAIASSLSFTVIKEKGNEEPNDTVVNENYENSFSYIAGGLGGLALVAVCLLLIDRIKNAEKNDDQN